MRYDLIIREKDNTPVKIVVTNNALDAHLIDWEYRMRGYKVDTIENK